MGQGMTGLDWVVVMVLMVIFIDAMRSFNGSAMIFRWLKGLRVSHYLTTTPGYEEVYTTYPGYKLRTESQRMSFYKRKMGSIIEISHGFLRRRSAIYGEAARNWIVSSDRAWPNTLRWVYLQDRRGVRIEDALPLINKYPSLQAMLDRIAELEIQNSQMEKLRDLLSKLCQDKNSRITELERELEHANERRQEWYAGIKAILEIVNRDRQTYRSVAAGRIRNRLDAMIHSTYLHEEPLPPEEKVQRWLRIF